MTISCSRLGRIEANRGERVPWGVICGHLSENTQKIGFNSNIAPSYSTRVSTYHVEHVVRSLHYPLTSLASRCAPRVTCHGAEAAHTLTGALLRSPRYLAPPPCRGERQRAEAAHTHSAGPAVYLPPGAVQSSPRWGRPAAYLPPPLPRRGRSSPPSSSSSSSESTTLVGLGLGLGLGLG